MPEEQQAAASVLLDDDLIEEFLAYSRDVKRNTATWVGEQRRYLAGWKEALGEVDLRTVSLGRDIEPALKGDGAFTRQKRIAAIKTLYGWLRKVRHSQALRGLDAGHPGSAAERARAVGRDEGAHAGPVHAVQGQGRRRGVRRRHDGPGRDGLAHHRGGDVRQGRRLEELPAGTPNPEADVVLVCPPTKGGEPLETRGGGAPAEGVRFRHSVATWAINKGAAPKDVSAFLGHKSERTTRKFYATHAVPAKVPTLV